ncbi:phytase [Streptomyces sp. NPDC090022]|uniref:phytase n=1 Tax=Streptomyces sp. NPDC090022 TaxID=3365920 RepID=UPI003828C0C1
MTLHRRTRPAALPLGAAAVVLATALTAPAAAHPVPASASAHAPGTARPPSAALPAVTPTAETAPLFDDEAGGNADADDPAIWRNRLDPARSLVVATAKEGGLRVYGLDAREVQALPAPAGPGADDAPGRFNNVDLVQGSRLTPGRADLAVVTDRGNDRLRFYRIDPGRPHSPLTDITDPAARPVFSADQSEINEQRTAYGLATWTDPATGRSYALVSRRHETTVALLELLAAPGGTVGYRKVRTLDLPGSFRMPDGGTWTPCAEPGERPQVEGMVVDPANGMLYAGQEDVGIWRVRADLTSRPELVDRVREYGVPATYDEESGECVAGADPGHGGRRLSADVEGLTLIDEPDGDGYLMVSSQGDDTFAFYDREVDEDNEYEAGLRITARTRELDGSEECDGAAALDQPLGPLYPRGLLVVQDGHDAPHDGARTATGFKFVDLGKVLDRIDG